MPHVRVARRAPVSFWRVLCTKTSNFVILRPARGNTLAARWRATLRRAQLTKEKRHDPFMRRCGARGRAERDRFERHAVRRRPAAALSPSMVDDGYGRIRPCSGLYKRQHPNWRAGAECMTDDG